MITALAIAALYHVFAVGRYSYPEYRLAVGQVSDFELIAPFDFPVLKSEKQLQVERQLAESQVEKPYRVSDQVIFDSYDTLARLFALFGEYPQPGSEEHIEALRGMNAQPDPAFLALGQNPELQRIVHDRVYSAITNTYKKAIYEPGIADSISVVYDDQLRRFSIKSFQSLDEARKLFRNQLSSLGYSSFADWMAMLLINSDLITDNAKYEELKQQVSNSVALETGEVLQNEIIIHKNAKVNESDINKLNSLTEAYRNKDVRRSSWERTELSLGMLMYILIVLLTANYAYPALIRKEYVHDAIHLPINFSFLMMSLLAILNHQIFGFSSMLIPFAFSALAIATLAGFEAAILLAICNAMILNPFLNWEIYTPSLLLLSTLSTLVMIRRFSAWHGFFRMWLLLSASVLVVNLALSLYKSDTLITILRNSGFGLISALLSVLSAAAIISFYEKRWNRSTKQTLLELLDFNHPLLKQLATSAIGTYHHSLVVGNLAERAAEAIGANPLLARVGSYYHDIGKVINNDYFTENNINSSEIHDRLEPVESARLIRDHVKEGVILAGKYRLPQDVIDIIQQHHGSSQIRYFLDLAQRMGSVEDPDDFCYPGPKPSSKEAALVMLGDIVESTTKAKNLNSPEELEKIIDNTIQRLINDGQLNDAPITISDLQKAKRSMLPILESIYRKRLDYPDEQPVKTEPSNA